MRINLLKHYRLLSFLSGWLAVAALPPYHVFRFCLSAFHYSCGLFKTATQKAWPLRVVTFLPLV